MSAEEYGPKPYVPVTLLTSVTGKVTRVLTIMVCKADNAILTLQFHMFSYSVAHNNGCGFLAICRAFVLDEMKSYVYRNTFHTTYEMPFILFQVYSAGVPKLDSYAVTPLAPGRPYASLSGTARGAARRRTGGNREQ